MNYIKLPSVMLLLLSILGNCSNSEQTENKDRLSDSGIQLLEKSIEYRNNELQKTDLFEVRLYIPTARENFLKVDKKQSELTQVTDDKGTNLLDVHSLEHQASEGRWWHVPEIFSASGKHPFEPGIWTDISLMAAPITGAEKVKLKGNLVLLYDTGETVSDTLRNLPLRMNFEEDGVDTKIGEFKIFGTGSIITDDTRYWSYSTISDAEIVRIEVVGNDDTQKVRKSMGERAVSDTGFALLESSELETITLRVTTMITRSENVPLDLSLVLDD